MTSLRPSTMRIDAASLGLENPLPPLIGRRDVHDGIDTSVADAEMVTNIGYGGIDTPLPYLMQDGYDRDLCPTDLRTVELANDRLRAVFLPGLGGRLWSLTDLSTGRELLHRNQIWQPANLALRNAWFAGGVEWNIGATGHTPLTCTPLHTASLHLSDGTPLLRMWEFERIREIVYQIDAWLPHGSPVLYVRPRIVNPQADTVPMYWWSNIAVPQTEGTRVVVPADSAYHMTYSARLSIVPIPGDPDVTYPARAETAADFFFTCDRTWIAALDESGCGLVQASTPRLRGRKLFRWGTGTGGLTWQRFLSGESAYLEIQAGLARTQLERIPMPGGTEWSWVEVYGALSVPAARVHGDFTVARATVEEQLDCTVTAADLEVADAAGRAVADTPPEHRISDGSGWGALEARRRAAAGEAPLAGPGTPFDADTLASEQAPWLELLETGRFPESATGEPPTSYLVSPAWRALLEAAPDSPTVRLHRGVAAWHAGDVEAARTNWTAIVDAADRAGAAGARGAGGRAGGPGTAWALRNLGITAGDPAVRSELLELAHSQAPGVLALTVETVAAMVEAGRPEDALRLVAGLTDAHRSRGRIQLLTARAAFGVGDLDRAGRLLEAGIVVPDLREGEVSLSALWFDFCERREARRLGVTDLDDATRAAVRAANPVPAGYDFRMRGS